MFYSPFIVRNNFKTFYNIFGSIVFKFNLREFHAEKDKSNFESLKQYLRIFIRRKKSRKIQNFLFQEAIQQQCKGGVDICIYCVSYVMV